MLLQALRRFFARRSGGTTRPAAVEAGPPTPANVALRELEGCGDLLACGQIAGAREYQEDRSSMTVLADEDEDGCDLLMVLADGMGGHAGGAEASALAVDHFVRTFESAKGGIATRLRASLDAANDAIGRHVAEHPRFSGMGCTLVGCVVTGDEKAHWISVGDSPMWRVRAARAGDAGGMDRLNDDHSTRPLLDNLVRLGQLTEEDAAGSGHQLRSAVIGAGLKLVDEEAGPVELGAGDRLILASDGLETLAQSEVLELSAGERASAIASKLLQAVEAKEKPSQDNATVVVYRHVEPGALRRRWKCRQDAPDTAEEPGAAEAPRYGQPSPSPPPLPPGSPEPPGPVAAATTAAPANETEQSSSSSQPLQPANSGQPGPKAAETNPTKEAEE